MAFAKSVATAKSAVSEGPIRYNPETKERSLDALRRGLILQELRDLGKLVILVSHDNRLLSFTDRVYTVSNGKTEPESTVGTRYLKRESFKALPSPGSA